LGAGLLGLGYRHLCWSHVSASEYVRGLSPDCGSLRNWNACARFKLGNEQIGAFLHEFWVALKSRDIDAVNGNVANCSGIDANDGRVRATGYGEDRDKQDEDAHGHSLMWCSVILLLWVRWRPARRNIERLIGSFMEFWNQAGIFVRTVSIGVSAIIGLWLIKVSAFGGASLIERMLLPLERRAFQWLQDRATARALGIDIDIIRVRRKSEFPKSH
jgi:hypothetical protein